MATSDPLPHLHAIDELADTLGVTKRRVRRQISERRALRQGSGASSASTPAEIARQLDAAAAPGSQLDYCHPAG